MRAKAMRYSTEEMAIAKCRANKRMKMQAPWKYASKALLF